MVFQINNHFVNLTWAFGGTAVEYNRWFIAQFTGSKRKQQSEICLKMNVEPQKCIMVGGFYDEGYYANGRLQIGGDYPPEKWFKGYIRKVKFYDWPQLETSVKIRVRHEPYCHDFHNDHQHSHPNPDPYTNHECAFCDHDYNYTCFTNCKEPDTWDFDCKQCNAACWTCSGSDTFQCYSCDDPDYHFHDRGTVCPETCGDGILLGHYQCDDGDNQDKDGCTHDCHYEPGFDCLPGTPTSPTVCSEICGDG